MFPYGSTERVIAYLHDTIEDTDTKYMDIAKEFSPYIATAVLSMTKTPGIPYDTYIRNLSKDKTCRKVKIADILHNLSTNPTERQITKYVQALKILCL